MKKLKCLGEGYIWFGGRRPEGGYTNVTLTSTPNWNEKTKYIKLKLHRLGAWKKVRLLVEVIE